MICCGGIMVLGKCKLCGNVNIELLDSHIIPEFLFISVYDNKHRYIDFSEDQNIKAKFVQKGIHEKLLCHDCEVLLSRYEKSLHDFILEFWYNKNKSFIKLLDNFAYMKHIDYVNVKIALLLILYRMSVSQLVRFKGYSLGVHEEIIRDIILHNQTIDRYTYGIHISPVTISGKYNPGLILTYEEPSKYKSQYELQQFIIEWLLIEIMISDLPKDDIWHCYELREKGEILMVGTELKDVNIKNTIIERLKHDDIKNLINKLKYFFVLMLEGDSPSFI
jgi:hypothetical protein